MADGKLIAVDHSMTYGTELTDEIVSASQNTQLFSQAAAKAALKKNGVNVNDPKLYQDYTYYAELTSQLTQLGFIVKSAAEDKVNKETHSGELKIGEILADILGLYVGSKELDEFKQLTKLLEEGSDTGVDDFMTFWWNKSKVDDNESRFAIGPLAAENGQPVMTLTYFHFDFHLDDWRALFISSHYESFDVHTSALTLSLDMDIYRDIEDDIKSKIESQIEDHVKDADLSFS